VSDAIFRHLGRWGAPEQGERKAAIEQAEGLDRLLRTGWGGHHAKLWFAAARAYESLTDDGAGHASSEQAAAAARKAYAYYDKALDWDARCKAKPNHHCSEPLGAEEKTLSLYRRLYWALELDRFDEAKTHVRELRKLLHGHEPSADLEALVDLAEVGAALAQGARLAVGAGAATRDRAIVLSESYLALRPEATGNDDERRVALERIQALLGTECASELELAVARSIAEFVQPSYCRPKTDGPSGSATDSCRNAVSCDETKILVNSSFVFEGRTYCFVDHAAQCACGRQLGVYEADDCYRY
jgi:hypothetical protein